MSRYEFIAVYIMASQRNGTIYVGVTSNLPERGLAHREGRIDGFTKRYGCKLLVWWEQHSEMLPAIAREKQLKRFGRNQKLALSEAENPTWRDFTKTSFYHRISDETIRVRHPGHAERDRDPEQLARLVNPGSRPRFARPG